MDSIKISKRIPSVEEYIELRNSVGWKILERDKIKKGLDNSVYCVCIEVKDTIIGFGRIVGDYGTTFYIQDVIVKPAYQKQKIGTLIMMNLMKYIDNIYVDGVIIGLIAIKELDGFYKKFNFTCNENNMFYRYSLNSKFN
ncbi:GNAT family N-acetyltransferase [Clostridium ihumii]|uniref:GNAT family N-acetyltransferase n=1 Tax=Clostridium ihumii TaxID=1470356 RepID=UPI003D3517AF